MYQRTQRGVSITGMMILVIMIATVVKVFASIGPAYYDYYTIDKIIISLFRDGRTGSAEDFKRALSDRFQINNIRNKSPDDFIYKFEDKKLVVNLDYEVREKFVGNLDLIMHFKKTYNSDIKQNQ
jgi:hypothetical protein